MTRVLREMPTWVVLTGVAALLLAVLYFASVII